MSLSWWAYGAVLVSSLGFWGCGGGSDSSPGSGVLTQAPHCSSGVDALQIEGTVDGATVSDHRTVNINAMLVNIGQPSFDTPMNNLGPLQPSELEIHIHWNQSLLYGQTDALSGGQLIAPSASAHAGQALCIAAGEVGFVNDGDEDGAFKFRIDQLKVGADCAGDSVPVELSGCYQ